MKDGGRFENKQIILGRERGANNQAGKGSMCVWAMTTLDSLTH